GAQTLAYYRVGRTLQVSPTYAAVTYSSGNLRT
ncbi:unnamed protein product, partial [marine sediment metagenome]